MHYSRDEIQPQNSGNTITNRSDIVEQTQKVSDELALFNAYRDTAVVLASAIASTDSFEQFHVRRVQTVCEIVGKTMGLTASELDGIKMGALLHDIGKLGVSDHILLKPGALTDQEYEQVRAHAAIGANIIRNVNYPWDIAGMIRHHHECWDGSGYPDHIAGEQIPLGARIISVAEVYDALISDRCYREKWTHTQAVMTVSADSGTRFDPEVAAAFIKSEREIKMALARIAEEDRNQNSSCDSSNIAADAIGRVNREMVSMFEIVQSIQSRMQTSEILDVLVDRTLKIIGADNCTVFLADAEKSNVFDVKKSVGLYSNILIGQEIAAGLGLAGNGSNVMDKFINGPGWSSMFPADLAKDLNDLRCCMAVPMMDSDKLIGIIAVYTRRENAFDIEVERVLSFIARHAATAIKCALEFEATKETATRDQLTGLYNAGFLIDQLEIEISRASRIGDSVYVLGLDLDSFKAINDNLGHIVGDQVLCRAAEILSDNVREYDTVARMGGDEFAIILPQTTLQGALDIADRLRQLYIQYARELDVPNPSSIDMSIGIAAFPEDGLDSKTLLNIADVSMYAKKRSHKTNKAA